MINAFWEVATFALEGAICVFVFLFIMALAKLYFKDLCRIYLEEKVKAYGVLLEHVMGKVAFSAVRETLGQSDPSSKPN